MKTLIIIISNLCLVLTGCTTNSTINADLIKKDWVSEIDKYDNIYRLYVEDSLMFETLTPALDPVVPYKISFDTLIIFTKDYNPYPRIESKIFKYKIGRLDSLELILIQVFPPSRDTVFFKREELIKKNDIRISQLEFFSGMCLGRCPIQSIRIDADSTLYHFGYRNTKHLGLSQYKLNSPEFLRLQNRLNSIDRDSFKLCVAAPDASNFKLFIKSHNHSIETDGMFCANFTNFNKLIVYLEFLERLLPLDSLDDKEMGFRYKPHYDN